MNEVNRYLWRLTKWTGLALAIFVTLSLVAKAQSTDDVDRYGQQDSLMDSLDRNLGRDKVEVEFRWDWHLELCEEQLRLDHVLGQRIMIELNGKNGSVRCPISQFWPAVQYKDSL
tara:strand:+ start:37 stop:381 length:345 start_codon:yes stop_codon:yes gene_type:complete